MEYSHYSRTHFEVHPHDTDATDINNEIDPNLVSRQKIVHKLTTHFR